MIKRHPCAKNSKRRRKSMKKILAALLVLAMGLAIVTSGKVKSDLD